MSRIVLLDAGPLGAVAHPRPTLESKNWLGTLILSGANIWIPEITDYEVRRELLLAGRIKSIERLNSLKAELGYVTLTMDAMLLAAEFWAQVRKQGRPTADSKALDGDVILAAQAALLTQADHDVTIATTNVKRLSLFADAREWQTVTE